MKKISFFIILGLLLAIPTVVLARTIQESVVIDKDQVVDRNLIKTAQTIDIKGRVEGDVILAANEITISGQVGGDVIAVGVDIKITGQVDGNVRVIGRNVIIDALIGKNLNAFASDIKINEDNQVGWSALVYGMSIDVRGLVGGHLDAGALNGLNIFGKVGGDTIAYLGEQSTLTVFGEAELDGNMIYKGQDKNQLTVKSGAQITDQEFEVWDAPQLDWKVLVGWGTAFYLFAKLIKLFGLLIVGLLLISLFRHKLLAVSKSLLEKPAVKMGWGLVYVVVIPIILFLLFFTVIGIPLAVITGLLFGITIYLTKILIGLLIGQKLLKSLNKGKDAPLVWSLVLGTFIYVVLISIPVIGWLLGFIGTIWAFGALGEMIKKINWGNK